VVVEVAEVVEEAAVVAADEVTTMQIASPKKHLLLLLLITMTTKTPIHRRWQIGFRRPLVGLSTTTNTPNTMMHLWIWTRMTVETKAAMMVI
jgi:hypothetical protein